LHLASNKDKGNPTTMHMPVGVCVDWEFVVEGHSQATRLFAGSLELGVVKPLAMLRVYEQCGSLFEFADRGPQSTARGDWRGVDAFVICQMRPCGCWHGSLLNLNISVP
jgi:hypothetical protein